MGTGRGSDDLYYELLLCIYGRVKDSSCVSIAYAYLGLIDDNYKRKLLGCIRELCDTHLFGACIRSILLPAFDAYFCVDFWMICLK